MRPNPNRWIVVAVVFLRVGTIAAEVIGSDCPWLTGREFTTDDSGTGTRQLAFGDFDGDGLPDLVTANGNEDTVSVLLNEGMGSFAEHMDYDTGSYPVGVAVGDLDGDGDLDLATCHIGEATVSILMNNGDGSFTDPVNYPVENTSHHLTIADLDDDGDADLAVANTGFFGSGTTVSVLLNEGDGTFDDYVVYTVGNAPEDVAVGDLNGDGNLDLAVTNQISESIFILLGDGDGTFGSAAHTGVGDTPIGLALGDFDGDGDLDIAAALAALPSLDVDMVVLLNDGNATFLGTWLNTRMSETSLTGSTQRIWTTMATSTWPSSTKTAQMFR